MKDNAEHQKAGLRTSFQNTAQTLMFHFLRSILFSGFLWSQNVFVMEILVSKLVVSVSHVRKPPSKYIFRDEHVSRI